jgi:tetratricopeptide (TPR) repeat protein
MANNVTPGHTALVHITCKFDDGRIIDSTCGREPLACKIGGGEVIIPEIERALIGMMPGESRTIRISAGKANNFYDAEILSMIKGRDLIFDINLIDIMSPQESSAHEEFKIGLELQNQGYINDAISRFQKAIELNPKLLPAYYTLGSALQKQGHTEEAIALYKKILELCPHHSDAHNILGSAFQEKGQLDDAVDSYRRAIQFNPDSFLAHNNLGTALRLQGNLDEAVRYYQKALELNPAFSEALNNLGNTLRDKGMLDEAISCYRKAIQMRHDFADAHWNLAFALLLSGGFKEGWHEYEWRWKLKEPEQTLPQPLWTGYDIAGKTILLYAEQGMGDTVQFIRYVQMVSARGAKVIVGCQKELKSLLKNVSGVYQVVAYGESLPHFDVRCPLLSLPGLFNTSLDNIPSTVPYIRVEDRITEQWKGRLHKDFSKLNVGLVWAGSPGHLNDRNRSCPLDLFVLIAGIDDISFFNLQKEMPAQWGNSSVTEMKLIDYTGEIEDFSDTAGIIMNLDLVISVDTAVAHLAGALGKRVWTLLPFAPDWRWMLNRDDSPWYPTMKLFRQPSPGDWRTVIDHVREQLIREMELDGQKYAG